MVAQRKTTEPIDEPILREMVKQDRLLEWSDYYRALDDLPGEQPALLEPPTVADIPALVWTPEAQQLYHRIKVELWPGDALVCDCMVPIKRQVAACSHAGERPDCWRWGNGVRKWTKRIGATWRLELYQPERLHFKAVERNVVACSHTTRQATWWGRTAWFKHKYRALPWTPGRRFWTKREVMGKPYFRLVCGLREVCIEHIDPATQGWLQKQFAMYLAAKGVTAQAARVMLLPIALERDVEPVRARSMKLFEREKGE